MIVVDTNAVIALVLRTEATEQARAWWRHDCDWHAPRLLLSELRNVLVGEIRRGQITVDHAAAITSAVGEQLRWTAECADERVLAAAIAGNLSAYDAEFVAAAQATRCKLLTADKAILRAYPDLVLSLRTAPPRGV